MQPPCETEGGSWGRVEGGRRDPQGGAAQPSAAAPSAQAHASFLFRAAAALLLRHRKALLATSDACDAYKLLMGLGSGGSDKKSSASIACFLGIYLL